MSEEVEYDVEIAYHGPDFVLTVAWTTSESVDDETRATAAAEWFEDAYGFAPIEHAREIQVKRLSPEG